MTKKTPLVRVAPEFDYTRLNPHVASEVRATGERIRVRLKKTLEDLVSIGNELRTVKESLEHGQFGRWLQAEFCWTERTARNFMAVAERFNKTEIISEVQIQPTAAYLLAAPSVPDEARQVAIERANAGENITARVAKEIVTKSRKRQRRRYKTISSERFLNYLRTSLERHREGWEIREREELIRCFREIADNLEGERQKPVR